MKKKHLIKTKYGDFFSLIWYGAREKVYFVEIPAFPGVLTEARTMTEAKKYAAEVIELQVLAAMDDGKMVVDNAKKVYGRKIFAGAFKVLT